MATVHVAFTCVSTGRGRGWLAALLWGERTRQRRLHVPGSHPALPPLQVTLALSPVDFKILPHVSCNPVHTTRIQSLKEWHAGGELGSVSQVLESWDGGLTFEV